MEQVLTLDSDSSAIPFPEVIRVLQFMEYGATCRVMFFMGALTGCRIEEYKNMVWSELHGNWFFWHPGKNQKGYRKAWLPDYFIAELRYYQKNNRVYGDRIFGIDGKTFARYFNRDIRPHLGEAWQIKCKVNKRDGLVQYEYIYRLKALRKNWATHKFARLNDKWKNAQIALEFVCKEMKHSSSRITIYHYFVNFEILEIEKYKHLEMHEILKDANAQAKLKGFISAHQENTQIRMLDYV